MTFENWQIAHFRVLGQDKYNPYGTSVLEPARRIWRQLTLLEDAMMAYRIVRSPERRAFYIDVGNLPPQARIRINQVVADHKMIPESVTRVLKAGIRRQVVRATHNTNWLWTNTDRKRIADVSNQLAEYKEVAHDAYFSR